MADLKRLDSGYWLYRRNREQWCQWPTDREPVIDDAFGDDPSETVRQAIAARKEADHG